jgi:hypothetical protein
MGPPKTRAGRRIVTLPREVVEELAEHLGPVGDADAHVFTADKGGVLRPSNFRVKVWLPAIRAAGLAPLRPHDLRHTAVALWIAAGANPKEVSVRAGHASIAFTLDRYGHLFSSHDDELRDRLDAMHGQGLRTVPGGIPGLGWADGGAPPGLEPGTVALRGPNGRPFDLRRQVATGRLPVHSLAEKIRC